MTQLKGPIPSPLGQLEEYVERLERAIQGSADPADVRSREHEAVAALMRYARRAHSLVYPNRVESPLVVVKPAVEIPLDVLDKLDRIEHAAEWLAALHELYPQGWECPLPARLKRTRNDTAVYRSVPEGIIENLNAWKEGTSPSPERLAGFPYLAKKELYAALDRAALPVAESDSEREGLYGVVIGRPSVSLSRNPRVVSIIDMVVDVLEKGMEAQADLDKLMD